MGTPLVAMLPLGTLANLVVRLIILMLLNFQRDIPTPGLAPDSKPSMGAITRRTTTPTTKKRAKPKTVTVMEEEENINITKKHLTKLLQLPEDQEAADQGLQRREITQEKVSGRNIR